MICINPYHKLIYTLFGKFEYEQWKDQSNLEHSHLVSKRNSILSSQKLLYHLYYTILQHIYHPKLYFFPSLFKYIYIYIYIFFFFLFHFLPFPLFHLLPLALATKRKKEKKATMLPLSHPPIHCHPHISQCHPPDHPKSMPIGIPWPRIQPNFDASFERER